MVKKLPNVFANEFNHEIKNTQEVFYSANNERIDEDSRGLKDDVSLDTKINRIFNANDFVYKSRVIIETDEGIVEKVIIGRNDNGLITMDNEMIELSRIRDIKKI